MTKHYDAPWSKTLGVVSTLVTLLCLGGSIGTALGLRRYSPWPALLPLTILAGAAPFTVRGYTITADDILVHRLWWVTRLPLDRLQSARFEPKAMERSLRLLGNGGLFSFTGFYRNKKLGTYRAFVTDPAGAVVLSYPDRTIVISPSPANDFVRDLALLSKEIPYSS